MLPRSEINNIFAKDSASAFSKTIPVLVLSLFAFLRNRGRVALLILLGGIGDYIIGEFSFMQIKNWKLSTLGVPSGGIVPGSFPFGLGHLVALVSDAENFFLETLKIIFAEPVCIQAFLQNLLAYRNRALASSSHGWSLLHQADVVFRAHQRPHPDRLLVHSGSLLHCLIVALFPQFGQRSGIHGLYSQLRQNLFESDGRFLKLFKN